MWRFLCLFSSKALDLLQPAAWLAFLILMLVPNIQSLIPRPSICWSYGDSIRKLFLNGKPALVDFNIDEVQHRLHTGTCTCSTLPSDDRFRPPCASLPTTPQPNYRHVLTWDPAILQHSELSSLAAKGLNYIPLPFPDWAAAKTTLLTLAHSLFHRLAETFPDINFTDKINQIPPLLDQWIAKRRSNPSSSTEIRQALSLKPDVPSHSVLSHLQYLQSRLYFSEMDKAANQPVFTCLDFAIMTLWQRLSSPAFLKMDQLTVQASLSSLLDQQKQWLPTDFPPPTHTWLNTRTSFKSHKQSFRFLTNGSNFLLTPTDKLAANMSATLLDVLQQWAGEKNNEILLSFMAHSQCYPIISDYSMCLLNLPIHNGKVCINEDFTADISKCFESIPIDPTREDSLQNALNRLLLLIRPFLTRKGLTNPGFRVTFKRGSFELNPATIVQLPLPGNPSGPLTKFYSFQQYLDMCNIIATNAITLAGSQYFQQAAGLPMGTSSAPSFCNLYMLDKEIAAILRITRYDPPAVATQKIKEFRFLFRMMDDVRAINAPTLVSMISNPGPRLPNSTDWIYPECLSIEPTCSKENGIVKATNFLDIETWLGPSGATYTTFAKESKLSFQPIQYVDPNSNRPLAACYNVAIGATYHALIHASSAKLAVKRLSTVMTTMKKRNFKKDRLRKLMLQSIRSLSIPGLPFSKDAAYNLVVRSLH